MSNEAETSLVLAEGRVRDSSTTLGMTQWKPLVGGFPTRPRRVRAGLARPIRERFWDRAPFTSGHTRRPILPISRLRFARCVVSAVSAEARICAGTAHATDPFHRRAILPPVTAAATTRRQRNVLTFSLEEVEGPWQKE